MTTPHTHPSDRRGAHNAPSGRPGSRAAIDRWDAMADSLLAAIDLADIARGNR